MKSFKKFLQENYKDNDIRNDNLEEWINNDKDVETKDKRQVIIKKIEIADYPNKIIGCVKMKDKLYDFEWNLKGECLKSTDELGNKKEPDEDDYLFKKLN